jgi:hypothetical protein
MKTTPKDNTGRAKLLRLFAKNVKTLRVVEIDDFGEILEIRGDTGQGKTSILESIEAGLRGLDPAMVRNGEDSAEIVLELDIARVQRIVRADGRKDILTVTDSRSGKPIDRAKEFLKALCPDGVAFRPLEFVQLGGGDTRGRTERLRQQRNMLLDAMPVTLELQDVAGAIQELGEAAFQEASGISLDGVDWEQHGLGVCAALEKVFYEARKSVNAKADESESALRHAPAPSKAAPRMPLAECQAAEQAAQQAYYKAQAEAGSRAGTLERRKQLAERIDREAAQLVDREALTEAIGEAKRAREELLKEHETVRGQIEALKRRLEEIEKSGRESADQIHQAELMVQRHEALDAHRAELAEIDATTGPAAAVDLTAMERAWRQATEDRTARELQDRYDAASKRAIEARDRAKAFDALVELFRDTLPRRIVETMKMPVEGLGIQDGVVTYRGIPLHQLGTSEQLKIAVLLAHSLNTQTGFVLIDRAESLGSKDRLALAEAAKELGLQLVLTYVDPLAMPSAGTIVMREGERVQ